MKTLKLWNGRWFKCRHLYIAAYSQKDAVAAVLEVFPNARFTLHELQVYFSSCWGNSMMGIEPERGVWVQTNREKPERKEKKENNNAFYQQRRISQA